MRKILFLTAFLLLFFSSCKTRQSAIKDTIKETSQYNKALEKFLYNVAGLKKGDTLEKVYELYGEPTSHRINDEEYRFNTVYYNAENEKLVEKRALSFSYYKDTHKIYTIGIYPAATYFLNEKGREDIIYTDLHMDEIREIFGPKEAGHVGNLRYDEDEFSVEFYCYEFYGHKCLNYDIFWWRKD